ncbi:hypothetical protein [Photobacterium leiognathi]|uniref:hypothetical protein n=1 Tax=Photobacterium leiognathi TaxID=553611 RepID=UPI0029821FDA|nr:hypothetical protein [Photobacterium leiognathi]
MAFETAVFNKDGRFHWFFNEKAFEISLPLKKDDLTQTWYMAELFVPDEFDYDTSIHDKQIEKLLSKPDELVVFKPSENYLKEVAQYGSR